MGILGNDLPSEPELALIYDGKDYLLDTGDQHASAVAVKLQFRTAERLMVQGIPLAVGTMLTAALIRQIRKEHQCCLVRKSSLYLDRR